MTKKEKPKKSPPEAFPGFENVAEQIREYVFVCFYDEKSCEACKKMDRVTWSPGSGPPPFSVPLKGCTSPEGCRCDVSAVFKDEGKYTSRK
jgi:hypothetical protein